MSDHDTRELLCEHAPAIFVGQSRGITHLVGIHVEQAVDEYALDLRMRFRRAGVGYVHTERARGLGRCITPQEMAQRVMAAVERGFDAVTLGQARRAS